MNRAGIILSLVSLLFLNPWLKASPINDWHTQSNFNQLASKHVHLELEVDFARQQLKGFIEHHLTYVDQKVRQLDLDTRDLTISRVTQLQGDQWQAAEFKLDEPDPVRGTRLSIKLGEAVSKVRVYYNSTPKASGLQWLQPAQTAGKKYPFMFSQSQAIHARSWMPIQDTPAMRVTYSATIKTDKHLRPIMSANNNPQRDQDGVYRFTMPQAIPPYLIAIAAGDIHYQKMSRQTAIYSEPAYLQSAAQEFADTQAMIEAAEKLFGQYRWDQYDLLILPPSFPFGGMENPRVSFITPTVLAGDKSLVSMIAHELAHSWSGNLVTNATWRDLWLNEGFTTYVENRIMEAVYGKERAMMEQVLGKQGLETEMRELDCQDQILHLQVQGRDPDDAFSDIPYVKGQLFLLFLEQRFGREKFDAFIRNYFDDHAFQSITTQQFYQYLTQNLLDKYPDTVTSDEVNEWLNQPGLPKMTPKPASDAFGKIDQHIQQWLQEPESLNKATTNLWTVHEWLYFINNLPETISASQMKSLDDSFQLTKTTNDVIASAWFLLSIKTGYSPVNPDLKQYLIRVGRRYLVVALYKELIKSPKGLAFAKEIYQLARPGYHPLTQSTLDAMVK